MLEKVRGSRKSFCFFFKRKMRKEKTKKNEKIEEGKEEK